MNICCNFCWGPHYKDTCNTWLHGWLLRLKESGEICWQCFNLCGGLILKTHVMVVWLMVTLKKCVCDCIADNMSTYCWVYVENETLVNVFKADFVKLSLNNKFWRYFNLPYTSYLWRNQPRLNHFIPARFLTGEPWKDRKFWTQIQMGFEKYYCRKSRSRAGYDCRFNNIDKWLFPL